MFIFGPLCKIMTVSKFDWNNILKGDVNNKKVLSFESH